MPAIWTAVLPVLMLIGSNVFMTFAWYGHLKVEHRPLWIIVLVSWGIAFFEYWLAVPANRIGRRAEEPAQLKAKHVVLNQAVLPLIAVAYLGERITLNHAVGFALIAAGAFFVFKGPLPNL